MEKWAPHIVGLHSCGGGILSIKIFFFHMYIKLLKNFKSTRHLV